jgi:EmrB/QacA subfamily drug resistance transporter
LLTSTLAIPVFGRLADQWGRRTVFLAGLVEFIVASILCGLSPDMVSFIVFRGLQGLGGGILVSNAFALAGEIARPERRGAYMGMIGAMFGVAGLLGPSVGGLLADGPGWRWAFYINLPLGLAALGVLVFGLRHVKEHRRPQGLDPVGLGLFVLAVVPFLLALSWGGRDFGWTDPLILGLVAGATLFLALFLVWEQRHPERALLPPFLFRNLDFNLAALAIFLSNAAFFGAILFLPLWLQEVLGASAAASGLSMTPLLVAYTVASVGAGQLVGRARTVGLAAAGFGLLALAGALVFLVAQPTTGLPLLTGGMVLLGLGLGANTPVIAVVAQNSVEPRAIGLATATNNFFRNLGGAVGSAVFGSVFLTRLHDGLAVLDWGSTPEAFRKVMSDPKVLMSPGALKALGTQVPEAYQPAFHRVMGQVDDKIAGAIGGVFIVMVVVALVSLPVLGLLKGRKWSGGLS